MVRKVRKIKQRERLEIDIVAVVMDYLIREWKMNVDGVLE